MNQCFQTRCQDVRWESEVAKMAAFAAQTNRNPPPACMQRAHAARRKFCVQEILHAEFASHGQEAPS